MVKLFCHGQHKKNVVKNQSCILILLTKHHYLPVVGIVVVAGVGAAVVVIPLHSTRQSACPASNNSLKSAFEQHVHLVVV